MGRVQRLVGRGARWAGPGRGMGLLFALGAVGVVLAAALVYQRLLGTREPDVVLLDAYRFAEGELDLASVQEVAWQLSVRDGGGLMDQTDALLSPPLPPPLCLPSPEGSGDDDAVAPVNNLIRRVDRAVDTGDRQGLAEALDALAGVGETGGESSEILRYASARGLAAGRDLGRAARALETSTLAGVEGGDVPIVAAATAGRLFAGGQVTGDRAVLAFHLRYLAGLVSQERGRSGDAVAHFRRALNAVSYLIQPEEASVSGGHYQRTIMEPGALSCGGRASTLTSLDAYTGLVAAYMSATDFQDPTRLAREVRRRGFEVDPDDPLSPLLVHAQDVASGGSETPIPENVFWASSNLQRVYHYNRLRPDRRLALSRAVLTLRVLGDPEWTRALGVEPAEECDMLSGLAKSLYQDTAAPGTTLVSQAVAPTDSAWAAVAVHTFARLESDCPDHTALDLEESVRADWLRLGGGLLHAGLVARYEAHRTVLSRRGGAAPELAVSRVLAQVAGDRGYFAAGRVPPDMSVALAPDLALEFVDDWRASVFRDVAYHLIAQVEKGGPRIGSIRAGDAPMYIRTVNDAVRLGGLRPVHAYRPETFGSLARSGGPAGRLWYRTSYAARSAPGLATGILSALTAATLLLLGAVFVNAWRYRLLVRTDFYGLEAEARGGGDAGPHHERPNHGQDVEGSHAPESES